MTRKPALLQVFTKTPVPGSVKTRLIPITGKAGATAIHVQLLRQTLETARRSTVGDIDLWCTPTARHPVLVGLGDHFELTLKTQIGNDLGERICFAMTQALGAYRHVLLIGSDCVDLRAGDIDLALKQLVCGYDVVLGPARDDGYYLIGMSRPHERLFTDIEWGTDTVLAKTREKAAQLKLKVYELPRRRDIDRPEDLDYMPD